MFHFSRSFEDVRHDSMPPNFALSRNGSYKKKESTFHPVERSKGIIRPCFQTKNLFGSPTSSYSSLKCTSSVSSIYSTGFGKSRFNLPPICSAPSSSRSRVIFDSSSDHSFNGYTTSQISMSPQSSFVLPKAPCPDLLETLRVHQKVEQNAAKITIKSNQQNFSSSGQNSIFYRFGASRPTYGFGASSTKLPFKSSANHSCKIKLSQNQRIDSFHRPKSSGDTCEIVDNFDCSNYGQFKNTKNRQKDLVHMIKCLSKAMSAFYLENENL